MAAELSEKLRALAAAQGGVLTCGQALGGGLTRTMIDFRLARGRWQRMQTGVYAVHSGQPGREAALWAALLRVGAGAALSHYTAAEVLGVIDEPRPVIHVTVPIERYAAAVPGVAVHRSVRTALSVHPAATPPRTRVEETVLDLADVAATLDDAVGWATRALGRRLTTQARLLDAMDRRTRLRWRAGLAEAIGADGVHSSLEFRYVRDVERRHALPRGVRQAPGVLAGAIYRDVLYDEFALAVELDGRQAHPAERRWLDIRRDNAAAAQGIITLRYGWLEVSQHPCEVAAQVAEVLSQRGHTTARGCARGCPVTVAASRPRPAAAS